ncbi:MAG: FtsX-like permease family protein, partial [Gammaproteobacteria bacterium]|nr:FtsX-like permease family protein [Gammaproteobacteria bacterium]
TVFERTREFGMLLALGTRPVSIVALILWEAVFMWGLGALIGLSLASSLLWWLADVGIYLGETMEEFSAQFFMPARIYPDISFEGMLTAPLVMLAGTLLAALIPALRIPLMQPVEALREE